MTREQMEKDHATPRIGGSLAATIALEAMGKEPPFGNSSFNAWARWKGLKPPREDNRRFEVGRDLEPALRQWHQKETGRKVYEVPCIVVHPQYPWATGHLDGVEDETDADWEGKTSEKYAGWDEEWSDPKSGDPQRVPMAYMLQNLWYNGLPRAMFGLPEGEWSGDDIVAPHERPMVMAVQFGLSEHLRIYRWDPDATLRGVYAKMFEACARWWDEYMVKGNVPPLPSPREARTLFPGNDKKTMIDGDSRVIELAAAYEEASRRAKEATAEKEKAAAELCKIIGNDYGVIASNQRTSVRVTWAPHKASKYVVEKEAGRTLRVTVKEVE